MPLRNQKNFSEINLAGTSKKEKYLLSKSICTHYFKTEVF